MQSRTIPVRLRSCHYNPLIGSLRKPGFTTDIPAHAFDVMDGYALKPDDDYALEFEFGLDLIVNVWSASGSA